MWHTWFDRDLGVAGRLMCRTSDGVQQKLVNLAKPICRIPSLAVHFGGSTPFEFNKEAQLYPIAGLVEAELNRQGRSEEDAKKEQEEEKSKDNEDFSPLKAVTQRHHPYLIERVATEAGVKAEDILDFELILYDCLLYTSPSPRDGLLSRMPSSA